MLRTLNLAGRFQRLDVLEGRLCIPCNDFARLPGVAAYFSAMSRLGDGIAGYIMLMLLPVIYGQPAIRPMLIMSLTALVGVGLYKVLRQSSRIAVIWVIWRNSRLCRKPAQAGSRLEEL